MSSKEQQPHSKDALIAHDKESNHSMVSYIQSQLERKVERAIDTRTYTHFFKEFGVFLGKRNLVDTGLGIIIGSAFSSAVQALVDDLFTPLLGLIFGSRMSNWFLVLRAGHLQQKARAAGRSFAYVTMEDAMKDGAVTLNVGHAVQAVLRFLAIGVAVFGLWRVAIKLTNHYLRTAPATSSTPATRDCPHCITPIPTLATRCRYCTQVVSPVGGKEGREGDVPVLA